MHASDSFEMAFLGCGLELSDDGECGLENNKSIASIRFLSELTPGGDLPMKI
jgi:hypothetical protein